MPHPNYCMFLHFLKLIHYEQREHSQMSQERFMLFQRIAHRQESHRSFFSLSDVPVEYRYEPAVIFRDGQHGLAGTRDSFFQRTSLSNRLIEVEHKGGTEFIMQGER